MARLGELCKIQSGGTPSRSNKKYWEKGTIPWVKISDIKSKYLNSVEEYITQDGLENSAAKIFPAGTILYTIFATLGEVCILDIDATTNQAIAGIQIENDQIEKDYLYYYLLSLKQTVNSIGRGVAQNNINMTILKNFEIPLPPMEEQRKIAAVLDKVSVLIVKRRQQLEKLDLLVKARFVEIFGDPVDNPKQWEMQSLSNVCKDIYGGGTPSKSHPEYFEGSIPWVSPKDMKSNIITDSIDHITEEAVKNSSAKIVPKDAVLMVIRSGILKHTLPVAIAAVELTVNQDMKVFIAGQNITSKFLMYYFKAIEMDVLSGVRGVTADNIDFKEFQKRLVIVPPIELQQLFSDFVERTEKTKTNIKESLAKLEMLKKALMQEYFG